MTNKKQFNYSQMLRPDLKAHIFSDALRGNVEKLHGLCSPKTKFCAVIKANAYGHGMAEIVSILKDSDVDFFAVASVYEAAYIAPLIENQDVLIFEPINLHMNLHQLQICENKGFHCVISSIEAAKYANDILKGSSSKLKLHVNIESGMGRIGIEAENAMELISLIDSSENLELKGVYTHFATADEDDLSFAYAQLDKFTAFLESNGLCSRDDIIIHAANSAATMKLPSSHFDMVRCGIAMYGYYSRPQVFPPVQLQPVMRLEAPIVQIKTIPKGRSVSYGRSFITERETKSAIVSFGYSDGYFRAYANKSTVRINDFFAPIMGRVCMDQFMVDVTDLPQVAVGDMAVIIDNQHNSPASAYSLAQIADTICYEILICVHEHVQRVIH